jgi:hypothetical protein
MILLDLNCTRSQMYNAVSEAFLGRQGVRAQQQKKVYIKIKKKAYIPRQLGVNIAQSQL